MDHQDLRHAVQQTFPRFAQDIDAMLARGQNAQPGGLVLIQSARSADIEQSFFEATGRSLHANPQTRFSKLDVSLPSAPFYSALARSIESSSTKAAPAQGWQDLIKGLINKGAVKAAEVEWSGLHDWLDLQTDKVTRERVQEFLSTNGVQVKETVLGSTKNDISMLQNKLQGTGYGVEHDNIDNEAFFTDRDGEPVNYSDLHSDVQKIVDKHSETINATGPAKYENYQLPGGTNYREVLLTLPENIDGEVEAWWSDEGGANEEVPFRELSAQQRNEAIQRYRDEVDQYAESPINYRSEHWDQPNVLAHIRVNDRTDADGKKVLFVEEIQSDWGQDGKKKVDGKPVGFIDPKAQARMYAINVESAATTDKLREIRKQMAALPDSETAKFNELLLQTEALDRTHKALRDESNVVYEKTRGVPAGPFVQNTDAWASLAVKRIMKMAVDGGYDKVAFVNGEQSADRYDLSKQVKYIQWNPGYIANRRLITLEDISGKEIGLTVQDGIVVDSSIGADGKPLDEVLGKDVADKIRNADSGSLRGLDLQVGSEGMKAFYNTIIPNIAKDVIRKLGGGKMETVPIGKTWEQYLSGRSIEAREGKLFARGSELNESPVRRQYAEEFPDGQLSQTGFTITATMREKASAALPLFSRGTGSAIQGLYDPLSGLSFLVLPNLTRQSAPAVLLHELVHSQQRADLDAKAAALLNSASDPSTPPLTAAFLGRVQARMRLADVQDVASEAMPYIVEQATNEGRQEGFSKTDSSRFVRWVGLTLGERVQGVIRDTVTLIRAQGLRLGLDIIPTVDDLVAMARMGFASASRGKVQRNSVRPTPAADMDRIKSLAKLEQTAGPRFAFWRLATEAIRLAGGNASEVDWEAVEEQTIQTSVGQHGQDPTKVLAALLEHSPGSVGLERQNDLKALILQGAPAMQERFNSLQAARSNAYSVRD